MSYRYHATRSDCRTVTLSATSVEAAEREALAHAGAVNTYADLVLERGDAIGWHPVSTLARGSAWWVRLP